MLKGYKVGDKVTGEHNHQAPLGPFLDRTATVIKIQDNQFLLESQGLPTIWWDITDQFRLAICLTCGKDPCACDDDVELGFAHGFKIGSKVCFSERGRKEWPRYRDAVATVVGRSPIYPDMILVDIPEFNIKDGGFYPYHLVCLPEDHLYSAGFVTLPEAQPAKLEPVYKKPLPAQALTSWPGLHEKMAAAKLLDELKDE